MSTEPRADGTADARSKTTVQIDVRTKADSGDEFLDKLDGRSAILRAARQNDIETMKAILANKPDAINERGHMGRQALHIAAESGNVELARFLIEAGADVNARRDERLDTPIFWAITPELATVLLDAGADIRAKDFSQRTPLHWSAQFARPKMVSFWLKQGLQANDRERSGMTPLHWAVIEVIEPSALECVQLLVDAGANLNAKSEFGRAPLHSVSRLPNFEQRLLDGSLKYGPGVREARLEILRLLLERGADPLQKDDDGESPFEASEGEPRAIMEKWLEMHPKSNR